jgi:hypothetical protein
MNSPAGVLGRFAANGDLVACNQDFLDLPFQIGNGFEALPDAGDDFVTAIAEIIAAARYPIRCGRLPDEVGAGIGEFGVQRLVERRHAAAGGLDAHFRLGGGCHQPDNGKGASGKNSGHFDTPIA